MNFVHHAFRWSMIMLLCGTVAAPISAAEKKSASSAKRPLTLIVTDPLARELACACVKGFGQRDYRKLSNLLASKLGERVSIEFSDDLADTIKLLDGPDGEFLVIGDRSLVAHAAAGAGLKCKPLCELSDRDGATALSASFVVRSDDPAKELKDISGRKLLVGLAEADQKFAAAMSTLRAAGVDVPKPEKHLGYNDAALDLLDSEAAPLPVAVLPGYAMALLQGCGSVKPGNLKVLAKTEPTPFITVFVSENVNGDKRKKILNALLDVKNDSALLEALESKEGFKEIKAAASNKNVTADWPDWRGVARDGQVPKLPEKLSSTPKILWKKGAVNGAVAGLSVSDDQLLVAERDFADENDVYRCFNATDGESLWRVSFPAKGNLDYGNAPRAAPVIRDGRAYLLGAFGDLRCLEMENGKLVWQRQLAREFSARLPTWGLCSPPLIVDDLLIVNPGGTNASLAGLDLATGATRWTTPGSPAAYAAFIAGTFGGQFQVIGYDQRSLGGWDPRSGKHLWQFVPPVEGDFNVPTPIAVNGGLLVSTENNGTRLYDFNSTGEIIPKPKAHFADLSPDTTTPVATNGRVFGMSREKLYCLEAANLQQIWRIEEQGLGDHVSLFADEKRVLVVTMRGELILLDAAANESPIVSRMNLFTEDVEVYAHPALVGTHLYARGSDNVVCVDLALN
jgi:outer membrane protein assembly factor BamB